MLVCVVLLRLGVPGLGFRVDDGYKSKAPIVRIGSLGFKRGFEGLREFTGLSGLLIRVGSKGLK